MSANSTAQPFFTASSRIAIRLPLLFGATIFLSACLLFMLQPLVSKMILPWFGGSAAVWVTAMLFFQTSLLLGYLYAHYLTRLASPKLQVIIHGLLLAASLAFLPILPNLRFQPQPGDDPTLGVFLVLGTCVGLPYTLLSATSPLVQKWFSLRSADSIPYRYFALSNAGSFLALFAFPLLIEPRLSGHQQSYLWSSGFLLFAILCGLSGLFQLNNKALVPQMAAETAPLTRLTISDLALWTALAACASALLLIVTNLLTQDIAPMPLLWVVPLGVYLLTFILCFDSSRWYQRWLFLPLVLPALAYIAHASRNVEEETIYRIIWLLVGSLFVACMACHGELSRLKPAPAALTGFYLALSVGGALGGLAIALLAPRFLSANYEYPAILALTAFTLLIPIFRERARWKFPRVAMAVWLAAAACCILLTYYATNEIRALLVEAKYQVRNFYGTLRIDEYDDDGNRSMRRLSHGAITHGMQFLDPRLRHLATTYYGRDSGAGLTWQILEKSGPIRMGVIGLGTGTLAAYGRGGDSIHFYDINPLVIDIAKNHFNYLADCPAHIDISLGDARLSLEHAPPQQFDILVVDAFSGDAIPVHLLTEEAFHVYYRNLKPNGVLAFHISNLYLRLAPVVAAAAERSGHQSRMITNPDDDNYGVFQSDYVLVTNRANFFDDPLLKSKVHLIDLPAGTRPWTDDFSNIWRTVHFDK